MGWIESFVEVSTERPQLEVADVFRLHWDEYRGQYPTTREQRRAARDIMVCRTAAMGGHVDICPTPGCSWLRVSYNPCDNRHCPKCGAFARAQWLEERKRLLLPVQYFHVVFTVDHALNPLVRANQKVIYNLLFAAASMLLKAFGHKYLGGVIGATGVLHTWGETLERHVHTHWIVTGGALVKAEDGSYRWNAAKPGYLFPVVALSREYRDYVCDGLLKLWREGQLNLYGECAGVDVEALVAEMRGKAWEVHISVAHGQGEQQFEYPARYINRVATSNYRLVAIEGGTVTFKYHDNRDGGKEKLMTLAGVEFIRRFMLHILPAHFVRVRHIGLHHAAKRKDLQRCRALLGLPYSLPEVKLLILTDWLTQILGEQPNRCPRCGAMLEARAEFEPLTPVWLWALTLIGLAVRGRVKV